MGESTVNQAICGYLKHLEGDQQIKVLYAVESGSRAWGFASLDSDFDIRFLYSHRRDWYLTVQKRRDVIEAMVDPELDFAGWDLPKALGLLRKSNPSLIEWLASPIVYAEDSAFMVDFRELASRCLSLNACLQHYLNMANSNYLSYFGTDQVLLKKYLYVLRPIFACRWIERYRSAPPIVFQELLAGAGESGDVAHELKELLIAKAAVSELGAGAHRLVLDRFIESELERLKKLKLPSQTPVEFEDLDEFFQKWIGS